MHPDIPCPSGSSPPCRGDLTVGTDLSQSFEVYEVSAHPVAFPALLAALVAPFHPAIENVERDVNVVVVLICWAAVIATYLVGLRVGMTRTDALAAAALLALASPWLVYARSVYSETGIGLALILALWAMEADRPVLASIACFAAAAFKLSFLVIAAGFVIDRILGGRKRQAALMTLTIGVCLAGLVGFNYWLARTPFISGNLAGNNLRFAHNLRPLFNLFFEPEHGLIIFAPWTIFAVRALGSVPFHRERSTFLRPIAIGIALYICVLAFPTFGPGDSYGPRYFVPLMPWLALASVEGARLSGRRARVAFALLALLGAAFVIPGILRYPEMYARPPWAAWFPKPGPNVAG